MLLLGQIILLLVLLIVCGVAPGFFVVRRFRLGPLEKFCAAIGLSLVLLYLAAFAIYLIDLPHTQWGASQTVKGGIGGFLATDGPFWAVSAACLAMGLASLRDLARVMSARQVRRPILWFGLLLAWFIALLAIIRNYNGGGWGGDWLEHFQRTIFFLDHVPSNVDIVGGYKLPARPPMMNLLAGHFLAQVGDDFELFQAAFVFLNLLVFFPCCLLARALVRRGGRRLGALAVLFAAGPLVMQNVTYTWTKFLSAFYVILAIWFYLAAWRKADMPRMAAAFFALSAGVLVHFSAGPYLVFMALHYMAAVFWKRKAKVRELAAVVLPGVLLLATWFAWSIAVYGAKTTFASNTAVTPSQQVEGDNLTKIAGNLFDTIVPHPLRNDAYMDVFKQASQAGYVRDYTFLIYQTNVIFGMGCVGGLMAIWLLWKAFVKGRHAAGGQQRLFWILFIAFNLLVGVAVHGERDTFGVAHVTLQPLVLLGVTFIAGSFRYMPTILRWLVIAGCLVDFGLGVLLQAHVESFDNSPQKTVFVASIGINGNVAVPLYGAENELVRFAWSNWLAKHERDVVKEWIALSAPIAPRNPQAQRVYQAARNTLGLMQAGDAENWGGWYARHDDTMNFLGDRLAWCSTVVKCLVLAGFAAMMLVIVRESLSVGGSPRGTTSGKAAARRGA